MNHAPDPAPDHGGAALNEALQTSFRLLRWAMLLLFAAYLASGLFVVKQHEKALVLVFGRVTGQGEDRVKGPGLHWTWPRPVAVIVRLPAERVQTLTTESFWYAQESEFQDNAAAGETLRPNIDGYSLTGDANLLHSRWAARYTVDRPEDFLFSFADPALVVHEELDRAVVRVAATFPIDGALRTDLESLRGGVDLALRHRLEALGLGIRLHGVDLLAVNPPRQVARAFESVVQSEQERAQKISDARAYVARTLSEAQGEIARTRSEGETYRQRLLAEVSANADYFTRVLGAYTRNPGVVRQTLLQDGIRQALAGVEHKYIVQRRGDTPPEIRLQFSPEKKKPAPEVH